MFPAIRGSLAGLSLAPQPPCLSGRGRLLVHSPYMPSFAAWTVVRGEFPLPSGLDEVWHFDTRHQKLALGSLGCCSPTWPAVHLLRSARMSGLLCLGVWAVYACFLLTSRRGVGVPCLFLVPVSDWAPSIGPFFTPGAFLVPDEFSPFSVWGLFLFWRYRFPSPPLLGHLIEGCTN